MSDGAQLTIWLAILISGVGAVVALRRLGLPATYARDLLHVGAGAWPLSWPLWRGPLPAVGLAMGVAVALAMVPAAGRRFAIAARIHESVTGDDERWAGLVLYGFASVALTCVGLFWSPREAAAGLVALALGDGLGGLVGRRFGRHFFAFPGAKRKSLEGSLAVAVFAAAGVALAGAYFWVPFRASEAIAAGLVAALVEAAAPRGTDNAAVPIAVWAFLSFAAPHLSGGLP